MKVISDSLSFSTRGFSDMKDLTGEVAKKLSESGLQNGIVNLFVSGSTGGLTTIEYESGLVEDFSHPACTQAKGFNLKQHILYARANCHDIFIS